MFDFLDKRTLDIARQLLERAQEVDSRYLKLSVADLAAQVTADFPPDVRFVFRDQVGFGYDDLPEFSFTILWTLGEPLLSIFGGDRFAGFMLQRGSKAGDWNVSVEKPFGSSLGPRAQRLATILERDFGVGNPSRALGRFARRFR